MQVIKEIKCTDCNDTGLAEVESVVIGRPFFCKENQELMHTITGKGDWHKMPCHCIDEED
jgi:hypothetical protein